MTATTADPYVAEFERLAPSRASEPQWLREIRERAIERFSALGFPTTRQEEWRFTNVAPIAERTFAPAPIGTVGPAAVSGSDLAPHRLAGGSMEVVFVDGRFAPELTEAVFPDGVVVGSLADVFAFSEGRGRLRGVLERHYARQAGFDDQPFTALNTAFARDGACIEIAPNAVVDRPLHLLFVSTSGGQVSYPRVLVVLGSNSQLRLVESYVVVGPSKLGPYGSQGDRAAQTPYFTNAVTELVLEDGAVLDHYRVLREAAAAFHVATTQARVGRSATFSSHAFTFGGAIARHDVNAVLDGEGGDCTLNGLYLVDGSRLTDTHTVIDHAQPHCTSHELYKGILADRSRAVFNGQIIVRPDAQKTDAKQTNKTLLLSDDAQIDTKPQLRIHANDVKCTHGATVGQLSADALFYLQARGIDRAAAQLMLVRAFAADVTGRVKIDALRERLDEVLVDALVANPAKAGSHAKEAA